MSVSLVSADPEKLIRYAEGARSINNQLRAEAGRLAPALEQFAATCTEYRIGVDVRLANELREYIGRAAPQDEWVRQVGTSFQRADSGGALNTWAVIPKRRIDPPSDIFAGTQIGILPAASVPLREPARKAREWLIRQAAGKALSGARSVLRVAGKVALAGMTFAVSTQVRMARQAGRIVAGAWRGVKAGARGVVDFLRAARDRAARLLAWIGRAFGRALSILRAGNEQLLTVARRFVHSSIVAAREYLKQDIGVVKGFLEGAWDTLSGTWTLIVDLFKIAIGDKATLDKYRQVIEAFKADPFGTLKKIGEAIVAPIVDDWKHGRYGEVVGRVTFELLPTILAVFTGGGSEAAYLSKLENLSAVTKALRGGSRAARLGRDASLGARAAAKTADFLQKVATRGLTRRIEQIMSRAEKMRSVARVSREAITTVARGGFRELGAKIGAAVRAHLMRVADAVRDIKSLFSRRKVRGDGGNGGNSGNRGGGNDGNGGGGGGNGGGGNGGGSDDEPILTQDDIRQLARHNNFDEIAKLMEENPGKFRLGKVSMDDAQWRKIHEEVKKWPDPRRNITGEVKMRPKPLGYNMQAEAMAVEAAVEHLSSNGYEVLFVRGKQPIPQLPFGILSNERKGPDIIARNPAGDIAVVEAKYRNIEERLLLDPGTGKPVTGKEMVNSELLKSKIGEEWMIQGSKKWLGANAGRYLGELLNAQDPNLRRLGSDLQAVISNEKRYEAIAFVAAPPGVEWGTGIDDVLTELNEGTSSVQLIRVDTPH
jgi:hypothetical protein